MHAVAASLLSGPEGSLAVLALVLLSALLAGDLAQRLGQPAVLGEILAGVLLGNLLPVSPDDPVVSTLAEIGVILLLFEVGLESTVGQMARVGRSAALVAGLGVLGPMLLGVGVGGWLLPDASFYAHLFLGATLAATSVGITARVLADLGWSGSSESRIILGAAVIDDVLGLVVLAGVTALVGAADAGLAPSLGPVLWLSGKAVLFLGIGLLGGVLLTPLLYRMAAHLRGGSVLLAVSLAFCFGMARLASLVGLAPIVGAFAAGLVLEGAHWRPFVERGDRPLEELVRPVVSFVGPIFFVATGMRVDLHALLDPHVLGLGAALTAAAVVGKQLSALGVVDRGVRRLPIGLGMIPRGEVGLISANLGLSLTIGGVPVISPALFSAVVLMVLATTVMAPPLLAWSLRERRPAG